MGSGTHGLQTRTTSPPPRAGFRKGPNVDMLLSSSLPVRSTILLSVNSEGGWTIYCRGMVIRCGEHAAHTTRPHFNGVYGKRNETGSYRLDIGLLQHQVATAEAQYQSYYFLYACYHCRKSLTAGVVGGRRGRGQCGGRREQNRECPSQNPVLRATRAW